MTSNRIGVGAAPSPTDYLDNELVTTAAGAANRQRVRIGGSTGTLLTTVTPAGQLQVLPEPKTQFADAFNMATIDTVNIWNSIGTAPTAVNGKGQLNAGTAAGATSALSSIPMFTSTANYIVPATVVNFEAVNNVAGTAFYTGQHRFIGVGAVPATWSATYGPSTTTGPLLDGVGFEIDTDGFMYAVMYQNGTRYRPTPLSGAANLNVGRTLANGVGHLLAVAIRADSIFWYVDTLDQPAAQTAFNDPGFIFPFQHTLPIRLHAINQGSGAIPTATVTQVVQVALADTGGQASQIADGTYPWIKLAVAASGAMYTSERTERVSPAVTPASPAATGTITAASGAGATGATGLADTSLNAGAGPAAGSVVKIVPSSGHASWSVQVTGTWSGTLATEVTMDGVTWIAVNSRASYGGRLQNNFSTNGLYRGVFGGMFAMRVRAITAITGTANVYINLGNAGAVFQNSDVVVQAEAQYYASSAGNNSMWGSTSGVTSGGAANTENSIFSLTNTDAAGGRVLYIYRISLGANNGAIGNSGTFARYRGNTGFTASGGTQMSISNRAGTAFGLSPGSAGYTRLNPTVAGVKYLGKVVYLGIASQDTSNEDGSILIPPGQTIYWSYTPSAANSTCMVEVVWWEGTLT